MERILATVYVVAALFAGVTLCGSAAQAVPLVFNCVAKGNSANCAVGEAQFVLEVVDTGTNHVAFILSNEGPASSAIARIYVDDGRATLAGPPDIHQDAPAVVFDNGAAPRNLPGAASLAPAFGAAPELGVMATAPHRQRGVNPGEHVGLVYPLSPGRDFGDVLADLSVGNLRVGIHATHFSSKGNQSFISQLLLTETLE